MQNCLIKSSGIISTMLNSFCKNKLLLTQIKIRLPNMVSLLNKDLFLQQLNYKDFLEKVNKDILVKLIFFFQLLF